MTSLSTAVRCAALLLSLAACGERGGADAPPPAPLAASTGQVTVKPVTDITRYAAARFADQASFGATPALVAEIEKLGMEGWIDAQFALPVQLHDPEPIRLYDDQNQVDSSRVRRYKDQLLQSALLTAPDQLRQRVVWAVSQWVPVSSGKVQEYATLQYVNLLQQHAFGNYGSFLRAITTSPPMGSYLDNLSNRPKSEQCPWCAPNENYSRELLQLFALGVVKLNLDGSTQRDAKGKPLETYTQEDVEALTRAMTGWQIAKPTPKGDYGQMAGVLVPDPWAAAHDRNEKRLLGSTIAAGKDAQQDLDAVADILMAHQNIAPFVSLRLIQHLVTSNPSPAYLSRVAGVFRNNGKGVAGDMQAVMKAVLLDSEARKGDVLGTDTLGFGKMREPVLWYSGLLRGLGCKLPPKWDPWNGQEADYSHAYNQSLFNPASVFSFYLPTDRAPGSNLLAPEQRLLNAQELSLRLGGYPLDHAKLAAAGCDHGPFGLALSTSPRALVDLISERYFRGAMPQPLRQNLLELALTIWGTSPHDKAMALLQFALATPYYGALR